MKSQPYRHVRFSWSSEIVRMSLTVSFILATQTALFPFGGPNPERLQTKRDIERAKAGADDVDIRNLPLELYPLLGKFKRVRQISLANLDPNVASDEKMEALSRLEF